MFHTVIIPTRRRAAIVADTVKMLEQQCVLPSEVILSGSEASDLPTVHSHCFPVRTILGPAGSSAQRNSAIDAVNGASACVTFLDDDVELAPNYLEQVQHVFAAQPELLAFDGTIIADGRKLGGMPRSQAQALLQSHCEEDGPLILPPVGGSLAGGDLNVRTVVLEKVRFDERLVAYGYLEDADFSLRISQLGTIGRCNRCMLVHLAVSMGRVSGFRFGISQIVNPYYLYKKGLIGSLPRVAGHFWTRALSANFMGCFSRNEQRLFDRRGRLLGNIVGLAELLRGSGPEVINNYR